ncbi:MAG: DUF1232 domain-containing protein [Cyclobacteriaceae bacterium]|nr:DUF1232 domain-containing protein [Cyclobacteriaceae bacterium]
MKNNRFFRLAFDQATRLAGKPARITRLLVELTIKISRVDWSPAGRVNLKNQVLLAGRLIKANLTGTYRVKSARLLIGLVAACIYFINPFDLVPDVVIGVGLADDMTVLAWVLNMAAAELQEFEKWERQQVTASVSL